MKYLFGKMNKTTVISLILIIFVLQMTVFATSYNTEFALGKNDCGKTVVLATTGEGKLTASADGTNMETIKWDTDVSMLAPRMQGKNLKTGWNVGGYWLVQFSTKNTSSLKFSADMFSSGKGPGSFEMYYSIDGNEFTPIDDTKVNITKNKKTVYDEVSLPSAINDKTNVYIKLVITKDESVNGNSIIGVKDGSTYINNIIITGGESGEDSKDDNDEDDDDNDNDNPAKSIKHYYTPSENIDIMRYGFSTGKYRFSINY